MLGIECGGECDSLISCSQLVAAVKQITHISHTVCVEMFEVKIVKVGYPGILKHSIHGCDVLCVEVFTKIYFLQTS